MSKTSEEKHDHHHHADVHLPKLMTIVNWPKAFKAHGLKLDGQVGDFIDEVVDYAMKQGDADGDGFD